jgi:hypothetical protein
MTRDDELANDIYIPYNTIIDMGTVHSRQAAGRQQAERETNTYLKDVDIHSRSADKPVHLQVSR